MKVRVNLSLINYIGFFKTVVEKGIIFKVRMTDIAERSVEFSEELSPEEIQSVEDEDQEQAESEHSPNQGEGDTENKLGRLSLPLT